MRATLKKLPLTLLAALGLVLASSSSAFAHVTVKPGEVSTATYQTFTVNVPNEKEIPTVSVKVLIPKGVSSVTPTKKVGWNVSAEKADGAVASIAWSGGEIGDGLRDEFSFSAKTPEKTGELKWKAYQTYADGTVVSWDQEEAENGHHGESQTSGPLSVTNVVAETAANADSTGVKTGSDEAILNAQTVADRALYVAIAAVVVALIAVFFATRKK